ncbi:hypothetical protein G7046_g5976 [Stylonectria norvegica]|nr:hypothetical protein G7046_g5976 [Stylonectria norvegica]
MSNPRGAVNGQASIPLIEIGSFVAPRPDKSEFIGSASGIFFANTVFRAFTALFSPTISSTSGPAGDAGHADTRDPGSVHSHLVATERSWEHAEGLPVDSGPATPGTRSYGIPNPGLGMAPPPATAKKLLMLYFRLWHPFFPFLHGPSFVNQLNQFYDRAGGSETDKDAHESPQRRLCRAVIFQCIFNISASTQDNDILQPSSRIQSGSALTGLLGVVCENPDVYSLQALLSMTLYLTTSMSLRAASTVHGALTRVLYHSGFHRCPYRYIQLPRDTCDIRQRIFWSAYILDRQLSQALGHPTVLRDSEIDVCIPGMVELHKPVGAPENQDNVHAHLPKDLPSRDRTDGSVSDPSNHTDHREAAIEAADIFIQSPLHHRQICKNGVGEYILGYLVTYWRLVGTVMDLFHRSIHKRSITWEMVLDITSRAHSWWNGLPLSFQDDLPSSLDELDAPFADYFAVLMDFKYSLQTALGASRSIIQKLKPYQHRRDSLLLACPGTLSATWMAGLVAVYAGRLELYPAQKAESDLDGCLALLETMNTRWSSAGHCHRALKTLRDKLKQRYSEGPANMTPTTLRRESGRTISAASTHLGVNEERRFKRRRLHGDTAPVQQQVQVPSNDSGLPPFPPEDQNWQPILQYIGPDFGFDADIFTYEAEDFANQEFNGELCNSVAYAYNTQQFPASIGTFSISAAMMEASTSQVLIGINGFGRIGRNVFRASLTPSNVRVAAINHTCVTAEDLIYLINHDSTHRGFATPITASKMVAVSQTCLRVGDHIVTLFSSRNPEKLDWASAGVEYIAECTGKLTTTSLASAHLKAPGVKNVIISAPSKDAPTIVYGINHTEYSFEMKVVSCASCTTNCVAPVAMILDSEFGIEQAFLTTIHASTQSQSILDGLANISPPNLREICFWKHHSGNDWGSRSSCESVAISRRTDIFNITAGSSRETSLDKLLNRLRTAAGQLPYGVLDVCDEELVSCDFIGNPCSAVVDAKACSALNSRVSGPIIPNTQDQGCSVNQQQFFKLVAWYDNEWAYSSRILDLIGHIAEYNKAFGV